MLFFILCKLFFTFLSKMSQIIKLLIYNLQKITFLRFHQPTGYASVKEWQKY